MEINNNLNQNFGGIYNLSKKAGSFRTTIQKAIIEDDRYNSTKIVYQLSSNFCENEPKNIEKYVQRIQKAKEKYRKRCDKILKKYSEALGIAQSKKQDAPNIFFSNNNNVLRATVVQPDGTKVSFVKRASDGILTFLDKISNAVLK